VIENVSEKYFEEGFGTETTQENESTTQKLPRNYPETTRERLLNLIASNPGLTRKELAKLLGITSNGVKYHIQKLTDENIIKREGSDRAGKWVIL
jgi:ATP-dependent DNA helicase RecG